MKRLGMPAFALAAFFTTILAPVVPASPANSKVHVFDGSPGQVFDAAVKSIEKNWKKVKSSDLSSGTIRFHTGVSPSTWGEDCTVHLRDLGGGKVEVSLELTNSAQVYAWQVGDRIARKLFKSVQDELSKPSPSVH